MVGYGYLIKKGVAMAKVTVYFFTGYDIRGDEVLQSKSMATLDNIMIYCGKPLMHTGLEVDDSELNENGFYKVKA